jgi:hypothetical protein
MLKAEQISQIVSQVVQANTTPASVRGVRTEPTTDSEGGEALRITIVVTPDAVTRLEEGPVLDTLVQLQDRLREAGEERFAIVEYATEEELENIADSQS